MRWTFGTLQAITKHRDMLLRPRYGWLGMLVLPWAVASIVVPLLTIPFVVLMSILIFTTVGPAMLGGYYLAFTAVQGVTAAVAVLLLRERLSHLLMVPLYRLVYEPLRAYLLYKTGYLAVRGVPVGWNKLVRSGTLNRSPVGGAAAVATPGAPSAATEADPPQRPVVRPVIPRQQGAPERDAGAASGSGTANEPLR